MHEHAGVRHSYHFALAIEGPPEPALMSASDAVKKAKRVDRLGRPTLIVKVTHDQALALLPGLPPSAGMRMGGPELDTLRERFGPLLGRLEEVKAGRNGVVVPEDVKGAEWEFGASVALDQAGRWAVSIEGVELRCE